MPGQAVTDLKTAGIDVQIQKGKVVISKDKVITKKGEVITASGREGAAHARHKPVQRDYRAVSSCSSSASIFNRAVLGINAEEDRSRHRVWRSTPRCAEHSRSA